MEKRKRWVITLVMLSLCIFGYQQYKVTKVALAGQDPLQVASSLSSSQDTSSITKSQINISEKTEVSKSDKINMSLQPLTLDSFIENTIRERAKNKGSDNFTNTSFTKSSPELNKAIEVMTNDLSAKKESKNDIVYLDSDEKIELQKNIAQIEKLSAYIADTYDIPLDKAEKIVYSTFVEANRKDLEPMLVLSVIGIESTFKQYVKSSSGAVGLTQIMPKVHHARIKENKVDIWSVHGNIKVGTDILRDYVDLAKGNIRKALQMYNGSAKDKNYKYSNQVMKKMQTFMIASK